MNDDLGQPDDKAKGRFMVLQMMRLSGIVMVMVGLLIIGRSIELPALTGYVLVAVGMVDALVMPAILLRAWKSPNP